MISFRKKSPRIYNRKWQPDWLMFNDIPFKMIPFNIKQTAGIDTIDLQQLWPAHRNDRAKLSYKSPIFPPLFPPYDDSSQMTIWPSFRNDGKNALPFQRRRRRLKLLRRRIFCSVEKYFNFLVFFTCQQQSPVSYSLCLNRKGKIYYKEWCQWVKTQNKTTE